MYVVQTYLGASAIEGIGVFAGEDIRKGQTVWEFIEGLDTRVDPADIPKFPPRVQEHLKRHTYLNGGKLYLCGDHGQYTNHSETPNTRHDLATHRDIALRDIRKGEEITADYREFDEISQNSLEF